MNRIFALTLCLLLALVVLTHDLQRASVTPSEALNLWLVRDSERLSADSPSQIVRAITGSVGTMFERARVSGTFPLYPLKLDLWALMVGDSLPALRWLSIIYVLLTLAVVGRVLRHESLGVVCAGIAGAGIILGGTQAARHVTPSAVLWFLIALALWVLTHRLRGRVIWRRGITAGIAGAGILLAALTPYPSDWAGTVAQINATRTPDEPALFVLPPYSAAGYYAHATPMIAGVALNYGWRIPPPDADTLRSAVDALMPAGTPARALWLFSPQAFTGRDDLESHLRDIGYSETLVLEVGDARVSRWSP